MLIGSQGSSLLLLKTVFLSAFLLGVSSCYGDRENKSETSFAIMEENHAAGGILGRIMFLESGYKTEWEKVRVCVQNDFEQPGESAVNDELRDFVNPNYTTRKFFAETKLGYFLWLSHSMEEGEPIDKLQERWGRLEFFISDNCDDEADVLSLVQIKRYQSEDEGYQNLFAPVTIQCSTEDRRKSCNSPGTTLGAANTGSIAYTYMPLTPEKYNVVHIGKPSRNEINPYIHWLPLAHDIDKSKKIYSSEKTDIKDNLEALSEASGPEEFAILQALSEAIQKAQMTAADDAAFHTLIQDYFRSNSTEAIDKPFRATRGAFTVLVHEIGHQFGMDHADNPGDTSKARSAVEGGEPAGDKPYTTNKAIMAYGDPFLYLTEDDQGGVRFLDSSLKGYMEAHK